RMCGWLSVGLLEACRGATSPRRGGLFCENPLGKPPPEVPRYPGDKAPPTPPAAGPRLSFLRFQKSPPAARAGGRAAQQRPASGCAESTTASTRERAVT